MAPRPVWANAPDPNTSRATTIASRLTESPCSELTLEWNASYTGTRTHQDDQVLGFSGAPVLGFRFIGSVVQGSQVVLGSRANESNHPMNPNPCSCEPEPKHPST